MSRYRKLTTDQIAAHHLGDGAVVPWQRPALRPYPVSRPVLSKRGQFYLDDVMHSGWWGYGPVARHLELQAAKFLSEKDESALQVLATSSCTAALHLALLAENIGPGDEVILPAFTYVSTASVIRFVGAKPVFADIDPERLTIDLDAAKSCLSEQTRAIIGVHYAGVPGAFDDLRAWAKHNQLITIDDAAHALGSINAHGEPVGGKADYTAFSFAATKPLPSCNGGLLCFKDTAKAEKIARLSMLGLTTDTFTRFNDSKSLPVQTVAELGYHYRMTDVAAAIALAQFDELEEQRALRMVLVQRYFERLENVKSIRLPPWPIGTQPCWYLMTILVDPAIRDALRRCLSDHQIDTSVHYPNLADGPAFQAYAKDLPNTALVTRSVMSLPLFTNMTLDDVDHIVDHLIDALAQCEQL